jgi:hydroxymethylbilane synthase
LISLLGQLNDSLVSACVIAERKVSEVLGADCSSPVAAYAVSADGQIRLRGLVASLDGQEIVRAESRGEDPQKVGAAVANSLLDLGAERILAV